MIVFVPVDSTALAVLRGTVTDRVGFTATPALRAGLELASDDEEEADFAAFTYAGVAALLDGTGARYVIAADVPEPGVTPLPDDPFGRVALAGPAWRQILAIYTDEVSALSAVARAREAVAGLSLADSWSHDTVERLRADHDLLWHLPDELVPREQV